MKVNHFGFGKMAMLSLTVVASARLVIAGTPGKCTTPSSCSVTCGSPSVPCMVRVSEDDNLNLATATMLNLPGGPGAPSQDICVQGGTEILWLTEEDQSKLTAAFGKQHPFKHTPQGKVAKFKGKKGYPASDTTNTTTLASECYEYKLSHCITGKPCKKTDPKVIVKGGTGD
jgi:hypothetical protein